MCGRFELDGYGYTDGRIGGQVLGYQTARVGRKDPEVPERLQVAFVILHRVREDRIKGD